MNETHIGNIIYLNNIVGYGFIEFSDSNESIFFHKRNCNYENLQLFDKVSFKTSISKSKKHQGKSLAVDITFIERGNIKKYELRIGKVKDWNGKFGYIDYPTSGKKIFLYHTRLLYSKELKNGDLIIFNPVISIKDKTQLFAFFAYKVSFEKDIKFLKSQYENYQLEGLKDYIFSISDDNETKLELELMSLGEIETSRDYLDLKSILINFKNEFSIIPNYQVLSKYISTPFLIQLWEDGTINSYDINIIKEYFIEADTLTKRLIIQKLTEKDKEEVIENYFNYLQKNKLLQKLNNDIKTLLSIVYKSKEKSFERIYKNLKEQLFSNLSSHELIDLWLHDYIDGLSENFIINNFDLENFINVKILLKKENGKYLELIAKIYEQYFINIANNKLYFEQEYPKLINYLKIYEELLKDKYKERYKLIINILQKTLKNYHKFLIWVLGVNIDFDAYSYIKENLNEINHYYRLKFLLRYINKKQNVKTEDLSFVYIDINGLKDFATKYKWNNVIYPLRHGVHVLNSFLDDVKDFSSIFKKEISIIELAEVIYNSIEKYNEIHIRLWLYIFSKDDNLSNKYYDYYGFRKSFRNLTSEERKLFRSLLNIKGSAELESQEKAVVKPCKNYEQLDEKTRLYTAFIENIYFKDGEFILRLEDGKYTEPYSEEFSSTGLNRIPFNHTLNKIPLKIKARLDGDKRNIINVDGLEELFTLIHTSEIVKTLNAIDNDKTNNYDDLSYAEDWQLRKQIIDYLNENQYNEFKPLIVNEPKYFYRRIDETSKFNLYEKTLLYTIKIENKNEYAIIWEDIDLTPDKATYIFKCYHEQLETQLQKIAEAISSHTFLRMALSSKKHSEELNIFKNNLGFITSIRKQRGKNDAFSNWLKKFNNALKKTVPNLPTNEELEKIKNWSIDELFTTKVYKPKINTIKYNKKAVLNENNLEVKDVFLGVEHKNIYDSKKDLIQIDKNVLTLNILKSFNDLFYAKFKIEYYE
jgi:cold shock CspA family protein